MKGTSVWIGLACAAWSLTAHADELRFKNGDRLTGSVVSMAEGKLVFASLVAGKVTVPMADLETFSTDGPITIDLDDGTRLQQTVEGSAAPGNFRIRGDGMVGAQDFVLARATRINPEPEVFHGSIAAGAKFQRGNSITDGAHVDLAARKRTERDRITFTGSYIGSRNEEENEDAPDVVTTTDRKLFGGLQYDYFISKKLFAYMRTSGEKNGVAELDLRFVLSPGIGYQVWELPSRSLSFETGPSWVSENYSDDTPDDDFLAWRSAWNYDQALLERLRFFHTGEWLPGLEAGTGHLVKTSTGLRTPLTDMFFVEGKVLFDWDSEPAEDEDKRDATYLLSIGYTY